MVGSPALTKSQTVRSSLTWGRLRHGSYGLPSARHRTLRPKWGRQGAYGPQCRTLERFFCWPYPLAPGPSLASRAERSQAKRISTGRSKLTGPLSGFRPRVTIRGPLHRLRARFKPASIPASSGLGTYNARSLRPFHAMASTRTSGRSTSKRRFLQCDQKCIHLPLQVFDLGGVIERVLYPGLNLRRRFGGPFCTVSANGAAEALPPSRPDPPLRALHRKPR
jgi:hypothetical protein